MGGVFGSTVLEIALGLFFIYFLLSIICSGINEMITAMLRTRATQLAATIARLLGGQELAKAVNGHTLITCLAGKFEIGERPKGCLTAPLHYLANAVSQKDDSGQPSYIPSATFATALLDTIARYQPVSKNLAPPNDEPLSVAQIRSKAHELVQDAQTRSIGEMLLTFINTHTRDASRLATMLDLVKSRAQQLAGIDAADLQRIEQAASAQDLLTALARMPDTEATRALRLYVDSLLINLADLRAEVEQWYNNAMDRLQGAYKRSIHRFLLIIAALLTLVLGVDTLRIARSLARDANLRTLVAARATAAVAEGSPLTPQAGASAPITSTAQLAGAEFETFAELYGYGDVMDMWQEDGRTAAAGKPEQITWGHWLGLLLAKLVGLALTAFAVSLGAPFWFDILKQVANIRAAGRSPEERQSAPRAGAAPGSG